MGGGHTSLRDTAPNDLGIQENIVHADLEIPTNQQKARIQFGKRPDIAYAFRLHSNWWWQTTSKAALEKSTRTILVCDFWFQAEKQSWAGNISWLSVKYPGKKPCCKALSRLWNNKWPNKAFLIRISRTLQTDEVRLIDRWLPINVDGAFFSNGLTIAVFQLLGSQACHKLHSNNKLRGRQVAEDVLFKK